MNLARMLLFFLVWGAVLLAVLTVVIGVAVFGEVRCA